MGYLHIDNLYKNKDILMFKECYAMEKIHGTSAHISFKEGQLHLFSGGSKMETFEKLFDKKALTAKFIEKHMDEVVIFGEAYGGKCQAMSLTYGKELKFVAFDVKVHDKWLRIPHAEEFCKSFGLEFVHYKQVPCDVEHLDAERDADSTQAIRNGCGEGKIREGIVIRPLQELRDSRGNRFIAKHKRPEFRETVTLRKVSDVDREILEKADDIALEWVTEQRLNHVMDKVFGSDEPCIQRIGELLKAMTEDVVREAKDEIVDSKHARKAISRRTVKLFKEFLNKRIEK